MRGRLKSANVETVILTGDRDTFQLITPNVRVDLASSERDRRIVGEEELAERYGGLTAAQQPDYKALVGDKSDNIPGVPGVGDKTAITLLGSYRTLEGIYEHLDAITQKRVYNSLTNNRELAFECRFLTTIDCDAPTTLDLDACSFRRIRTRRRGGFDDRAGVPQRGRARAGAGRAVGYGGSSGSRRASGRGNSRHGG